MGGSVTPEQRLEGVRALFAPRNIAIVGASDRPGNWSQRVYRSLKRFDFPGSIYAVNPRNQTVWDGQTCYPSLRDLPQPKMDKPPVEPPITIVVGDARCYPGEDGIGSVVQPNRRSRRSR